MLLSGEHVERDARRFARGAEELWRLHLVEAEDYRLRNKSSATVLDLLG